MLNLEETYLAVSATDRQRKMEAVFNKAFTEIQNAAVVWFPATNEHKTLLSTEEADALKAIFASLVEKVNTHLRFDPDYTREQIVRLARKVNSLQDNIFDL